MRSVAFIINNYISAMTLAHEFFFVFRTCRVVSGCTENTRHKVTVKERHCVLTKTSSMAKRYFLAKNRIFLFSATFPFMTC